jgi:DUF4097 and DUF4098 domain-containing protein YvlB
VVSRSSVKKVKDLLPNRRLVRVLVALSVVALATTLVMKPESANAKPKLIPITTVVVTSNQGNIRIQPCPERGGKGICAKAAKVAGGVARFSTEQDDISVRVPVGVPVSISVEQGDITLAGTDNPIAIQAAQSDVTGDSLRSATLSATLKQGTITLGFLTDPKQLDISVYQGDVRVKSTAKGAETNFKVRTMEQGNITLQPFGQPSGIEASTAQGDISIVVGGGPYNIVAASGQGRIDNTLINDPSATRKIIATVTGQGDITVQAP